MHPHGLSPADQIGDHDIAERVDRLERAPWRDDSTLAHEVLETLDVLAERLIGRTSPQEDALKARIHALRVRVAGA